MGKRNQTQHRDMVSCPLLVLLLSSPQERQRCSCNFQNSSTCQRSTSYNQRRHGHCPRATVMGSGSTVCLKTPSHIKEHQPAQAWLENVSGRTKIIRPFSTHLAAGCGVSPVVLSVTRLGWPQGGSLKESLCSFKKGKWGNESWARRQYPLHLSSFVADDLILKSWYIIYIQ